MPFLTIKQHFLEVVNPQDVSLDTDISQIIGHFGTDSCIQSSIMIN